MYNVMFLCENIIISSHRPLPDNKQHSEQQQKFYAPGGIRTQKHDCTSELPQTNVLDRSAIAIVSWFSN
jgi:hypothetical protein